MHDEYDDHGEPRYRRPARRDRRDDGYDAYARPGPPEVSVLGVLSLVVGIGSLFASFVPCVGALAVVGGGVGLLLGLIGVAVARRSGGQQGSGLPVAGAVVNGLAVLVGAAWLALMVVALRNAGRGPAEVDARGEPAFTLPAAALDREYDANEVAADAKYKGKVVLLTGRVRRVSRDGRPGRATVELDGMPESVVRCSFAAGQEGDLAAVALGQEVGVRGVCKGKELTRVALDACSLAPDAVKTPAAGPAAPAVAVDATDLSKEYDRNEVAADAKYKGKTVEVTGRVLRVVRTRPGQVTLEFETEGARLVDGDFAARDGHARLAAVEAGDTVVVRGTCRGKAGGTVTVDDCALVKD